jgi:hypothetical protein
LTDKRKTLLFSQLVAIGLEANYARNYVSSLQSSLSLEQQDAIDKADFMCETALKLLKTVHRRDEALKNALDGLQTNIDVFGQTHIDVARSESKRPVVIFFDSVHSLLTPSSSKYSD